MKKYKNLLFYFVTICIFGLLMFFFVDRGSRLEINKAPDIIILQNQSTGQQLIKTYHQSLAGPLAILLLQIITILVAARLFGYLCKKIGQPTVMGEIIAGIVLGPSFLGLYFPDLSSFLFPYRSLGNLQLLSQIGLILFMFIVGMELNLKTLKNCAKDALVISHASIIIPFALGVGLAYYTYNTFAAGNTKFLSYALFIGVAMSITAFPVLARIVQERGMTKTALGSLVITSAAINDISAWCILAAVIAIAKAGSLMNSVYTIILATAYVIIMFKLVQPFFQRLGKIYSHKEGLSKPIVVLIFLVLLISACSTELIGIHALFGAFVAGIIMPSDLNFRSIFIEKIEDIALVLLLPLFFVYTGLRTQVGLLNDAYLWQVCGLIIVVAIVGKFAGSALAARFVGQSWRDSLTVGALMNTRGLIELVVLNIGYDLGILKPEIFTMLVIMALFTTFITGPSHDLITRFVPERKLPKRSNETKEANKYRILISFGSPENGRIMLRLISNFTGHGQKNSSITAMHLSPSNEINQTNILEYEQDNFLPIVKEARKLSLEIDTLFKPSHDIYKEIVQTANAGRFDVLFIGMGQSVFEGSILGKAMGFVAKYGSLTRLMNLLKGNEKFYEDDHFDDNVRQIIKSVRIPVGIFVDRGLIELQHVFVTLYSNSDSYLLEYARRLLLHKEISIVLLQLNGLHSEKSVYHNQISSFKQLAADKITLLSKEDLGNYPLTSNDLTLISYEGWKKAVRFNINGLLQKSSVLIIKE